MRKRSMTFIESTALEALGEDVMNYINKDIKDNRISEENVNGLFLTSQSRYEYSMNNEDGECYIDGSGQYTSISSSENQKSVDFNGNFNRFDDFVFDKCVSSSDVENEKNHESIGNNESISSSSIRIQTDLSLVFPSPSVSPSIKSQINSSRHSPTKKQRLPPVPLFQGQRLQSQKHKSGRKNSDDSVVLGNGSVFDKTCNIPKNVSGKT